MAPAGSPTVPVMVPRSLCAKAARVNERERTKTEKKRMNYLPDANVRLVSIHPRDLGVKGYPLLMYSRDEENFHVEVSPWSSCFDGASPCGTVASEDEERPARAERETESERAGAEDGRR